MHLVGFIIRTYHDARSPERQISCYLVYSLIRFFARIVSESTEQILMKFDTDTGRHQTNLFFNYFNITPVLHTN